MPWTYFSSERRNHDAANDYGRYVIDHLYDSFSEIFEKRMSEIRNQISNSSFSSVEQFDILTDAESSIAFSLLDTQREIVNIATVGLYHLFERQACEYFKISSSAVGSKAILDQIAAMGAAERSTLNELDTLRLASNAAKHGDGPSFQQLRSKDLSLFPHSDEQDRKHLTPADVEVTPQRFEAFLAAVTEFWKSVGEVPEIEFPDTKDA